MSQPNGPLAFLHAPAAAIAALLLCGGAIAQQIPGDRSKGAPSPKSAKPNIILILTDDQDLMLKSMDYMPNVKALLADQGATFTNFFVPLSLCCPSRTGILRGQYPHNHKVWTNEPPDGGFQKAYADSIERDTVCTAVEKAGYKTFFFGKYLNGYPAGASNSYVPQGWDDWYSPTGGDPYSEYNYQMNSDGTTQSYGSTPSDHLTDVMSAEAVRFIQSVAQQSSPPPFFMHLTPFAPHRPSTPAPRHASLFPTAQAPRTASFNEADVSDKPAYIQQLPLLTDADIQTIDSEYRLRIQSLQAVDEMVAAVVGALQSAGFLGNTYIFFASDNGYHMGQHRFPGGKYTPYETDIRVPLAIRGPNVPAACTVAQFAGNVDLAQTIADLAGASLSVTSDGRSLVPLMTGQSPSSWRQAFFLEQIPGSVSPQLTARPDRQSEPPDAADLVLGNVYPGHDGYRTDTYKYVEYSTGEKEVYFLDADPDEMDNKASVVSSTFLAAASAYLSTFKGCAGAACLSAEAVAPPSPLDVGFTFTPAQPTDATPITFVGTADGTAPYVFTWDLGGQAASGQTVTGTLAAGSYTISLTVTDAAGAKETDTQTLTVSNSVFISSAKAAGSPLQLTLNGGGFKAGCAVKVNGSSAPATKFVSATKVIAKGSGLKAMLPKGVAVQLTVANSDGTASAPFTFTR